MGTGKSTVGQLLAHRLGRPFVDLDTEIERRAGKPIAAIFAADGEAAFRRLEAEVAAELAQRQGIVLATGGGALLAGITRRRLAQNGIIIELRATPETLIERLRGTTERPLLDAEEWEAELRRLYERRATTYARLPYHVDTTHRTPEAVVEAVLRMLEQATPDLSNDLAATLTVQSPDGAYDLLIGSNVLAELGPRLHALGLVGDVAIITDTTVGPLYGAAVRAEVMAAGLRAELIEMPAGEAHKTLDTAEWLYGELLDHGFDRTSTVVALGGGVVGDVAGFVAATYMRGVPLVQVPTTLLAMVDSSVGGKVGVDHRRAKNLIGAFKQPMLVLADTELLATLPAAEIRNGLAEVVKHGLIGAPELLDRLEAGDHEWATLLPTAVQVKIDTVEADPFEQGRRAVLNLGHTFAHALEVVSNFELAHGEAVAIGLVQACALAARMGLADEALRRRVESLLTRLGLPIHYPADPDAVWQAMQHDKKKQGGRLRFIVPMAAGDVIVTDRVDEVDVRAVLSVLSNSAL